MNSSPLTTYDCVSLSLWKAKESQVSPVPPRSLSSMSAQCHYTVLKNRFILRSLPWFCIEKVSQVLAPLNLRLEFKVKPLNVNLHLIYLVLLLLDVSFKSMPHLVLIIYSSNYLGRTTCWSLGLALFRLRYLLIWVVVNDLRLRGWVL